MAWGRDKGSLRFRHQQAAQLCLAAADAADDEDPPSAAAASTGAAKQFTCVGVLMRPGGCGGKIGMEWSEGMNESWLTFYFIIHNE